MTAGRQTPPVALVPPGLAYDARSLAGADLADVEVLARLALAARRLGLRLEISHARPALVHLVGLCGLGGVVTVSGARDVV